MVDWIWRVALLGVLVWVGLELHGLRVDLQTPVVDETVAASGGTAGEDEQDSLDSIRDDLAEIKDKVNAIMTVMARAK
jgi:hypothetical protein